MTEIDQTHQKLIVVKDLLQQNISDNPRKTSLVLGEKIQLGDTMLPDKEKYPGWSLTPFSFQDNLKKDGCLFTVNPNTATPVGLVGNPPKQEVISQPTFTEWLVEGSGTLLIETPDGNIHEIEVSTEKPVVYQYGKGSKVAYIAGSEGLEGVNIGNPAGIPEDPLNNNDLRASTKFWERYNELVTHE